MRCPRAGAAEPAAAAAAHEVLEAIAALPDAYCQPLVAVDIAGLS